MFGWQMMNCRKSIGCVVRLAVFLRARSRRRAISRAQADNGPASRLFQTPQSSAELVSAVRGTRRSRHNSRGAAYRPATGLEDLLALAGRCRLSAHGRRNGVDQCGGGESGVAGAAPLPAVRAADLRLWRGSRVPGDGDAGDTRRADRAQGQDPLPGLRAVCIPQDGELALDLPQGEATPTSYAPLVNRFASLVPKSGERLGWSVERVAIDQQNQLVVDAKSTGEVFDAPDVIVEGAPHFYFGPPEDRAVGRPPDRAALCAGGAPGKGRRARRKRPHADVLRRRSRHGDRSPARSRSSPPHRSRPGFRCCRSSASRCSAGSSSTSCPACCRCCC